MSLRYLSVISPFEFSLTICSPSPSLSALRLSIDSRTVLVAQENDPTQLRSPSPGKLVRYFIESGEHISKGQAYAEIEVMKVSLL